MLTLPFRGRINQGHQRTTTGQWQLVSNISFQNTASPLVNEGRIVSYSQSGHTHCLHSRVDDQNVKAVVKLGGTQEPTTWSVRKERHVYDHVRVPMLVTAVGCLVVSCIALLWVIPCCSLLPRVSGTTIPWIPSITLRVSAITLLLLLLLLLLLTLTTRRL